MCLIMFLVIIFDKGFKNLKERENLNIQLKVIEVKDKILKK